MGRCPKGTEMQLCRMKKVQRSKLWSIIIITTVNNTVLNTRDFLRE